LRPPPSAPLLPYTTLFRSEGVGRPRSHMGAVAEAEASGEGETGNVGLPEHGQTLGQHGTTLGAQTDVSGHDRRHVCSVVEPVNQCCKLLAVTLLTARDIREIAAD